MRGEIAAKVPQASSISANNMRSAYVFNNRRQRRRIEIFGYINRAVLKELGARIIRRKEANRA